MHDDDEKHEQRVAHRDEMTVRNFSIAAACMVVSGVAIGLTIMWVGSRFGYCPLTNFAAGAPTSKNPPPFSPPRGGDRPNHPPPAPTPAFLNARKGGGVPDREFRIFPL